MSRESLQELLDEIDAWCRDRDLAQIELVLIGGAAGTLVWGSPRLTADLDVVVKGRDELAGLEAAFGRSTGRAPWLEVVLAGIPHLPEGWMQRTSPVPGPWRRLAVRRLSAADQIASKLMRFSPHDRRDIEFLCNLRPEVRASLADLDGSDYWKVPDIWEDQLEPRRDRVLAFLDGKIRTL